MSVDHPLLRRGAIEDRAYQANIARACLERSTLVVLPTGMGKTVIAARVVAETLHARGGQVLFLAPTKPLVEQHAAYLRDVLLVERIARLTGEATDPEERELLWRQSKLVVSTPQVIRNDVRHERISLQDVTLIVFDEAHRAVGDYAYVDVAAAYKDVRGGLGLGMTASPGSSTEKILEVCANLGISGVEIRTHFDPDVVPYVHGIQVEKILVEMPDVVREIRGLLRGSFDAQVERLRACGFLRGVTRPRVRDVLLAGEEIRRRLDRGERSGPVYTAATAQALAMKINHAIELAETQGLEAFRTYMERAEKESSSRADRMFLKDENARKAVALARGSTAEHPKLAKVGWIARDELLAKPDAKLIVFAHYRDTTELVTQSLAAIPGVRPVRFVGQASRGEDIGLTQREQVEIIEKFRGGEYNVLVASSIGEEGLDIPAVDLVVFYEPVPSEIRTIQRRGRTGRTQLGRVKMLVTRDTRDEAYLYSARRKEQRMHEELDRLRRELRQKIFVGTPSGETFVSAVPRSRIEVLREASRASGPHETPSRRPAKKGQTELVDFAGS